MTRVKKIKQVKVKLGNADAKQQEIASGLKEGQKVITKAEKSFKDGETLKDVTDADSKNQKRLVEKRWSLVTKPALMVLKGITKSFKNGQESLQVLKGIDLSVDEGDFVAIMGPSGSGKSTLMNIIGLLDQPTTGSYQLEGEDVADLSENRLAKVRNDQIGFIFQQFFLLPKLSAQKNVELPLIYAGKSPRERKQRAQQFLEKVGLSERSHHLPSELSGGQKQRVAIARALSNDPAIILADEPTGALDTKTGTQIMDLLTQLNREGKTIVMVTHEPEIADYARRKIVIRDGEITQGHNGTAFG